MVMFINSVQLDRILTFLCKIFLSLVFSDFHIVGFCPLFRLWDFVLWGFVLWDFVRRDFVLWDFVLWDSVPDSMHAECSRIQHFDKSKH